MSKETSAPQLIHRKVVIIGDNSCGKTVLFYVFCNGKFPESSVLKIFDGWGFNFVLDGKRINISYFPSACGEEGDRIRPLSYPNTDVFLICFSIDSPESLKNVLEKWAPEVKHHCSNVPFLLVGNKKELRNDEETIQKLEGKNHKPVEWEQGMKVAQKIGAIGYMECSAKNNDGVREIFEMAVRETLNKSKSRFCTIL